MSHEIGLIYKGKKKPFQFDNPKTGKLRFTPGVVEWLPVSTAEWLLSINPGMFGRAGERGYSDAEAIFEDASEIIAKKAAQDIEDEKPEPTKEEEPEKEDVMFECKKCGRKYKDEVWYDKHIEKCEG